jgi:hypothetical protein
VCGGSPRSVVSEQRLGTCPSVQEVPLSIKNYLYDVLVQVQQIQ